MKTIKITRLFLVVTFGIMSIVSCEKADQSSGQNGSNPAANVKEGIIQDHGPINDSTRSMQSVFTSQDYVITNLYTSISGRGAEIRIRFFSNKDGMIPSGNYTYAISPEKVPFTFSDATVQMTDNSVAHGVFVMYNGSATVKTDGSTYGIQLSGELSNGYSFSATFNGSMNYSDNYK